MQLENLVKVEGQCDLDVKDVCRDSKLAKSGDVYFCFSRDLKQAFERCKEAQDKGATAVVSAFRLPLENSFKVKNPRESFALAAKHLYGDACDQMKMIGITGTNGKTTTSHIIAEVLARSGKKVGVVGTNGVFYGGKHFDCSLTTPDADFLHKTFRDMKNDGVEVVVMEVSAHAIDQNRIDGIKFDVGVLTNITQDHLDYFKTFENYAKTKCSFLTKKYVKKAVICADDNVILRHKGDFTVPLLTYGIYAPSDAFAVDVFCDMNGSRFYANICDSVLDIKTNLVGKYNVYNSLAGLTVCKELGLSDEELASGLNFMFPVEGRFNVSNFDGKFVVIDFAHSPDSLMNVLKTARNLTDKKVCVVFGCGGNRDRDKRHKMGQIAEKYADTVCLTDDNPRNERSEDIISDIEAGMKKPHFVEPDREKAIRKMIDKASKGDIVIIAGKGAEKYQEVGDKKIPYNDFDVVYKIFKETDPIANRGKEEW